MPTSLLDGEPPTATDRPSPPDLLSDFRSVFRHVAASTWVVTGAGPAGPVGFTAISVVSVSLEPPLVSFNIAKTSSSLDTIARTRRAALHVLSDEQSSLAARFAGERHGRFAVDGTWRLDRRGLPELLGVSSRLVTRVVDLVSAGDSYIAVAEVEAASLLHPTPLVHHAAAYHSLPAHPVPAHPVPAHSVPAHSVPATPLASSTSPTPQIGA